MLPFSLIFILAFSNNLTFAERITCPEGQGAQVTARNKRICEDCKDEFFRGANDSSQKCKACTRCKEVLGSSVKEKCTKTKDTVCQCREGFVPTPNDSIFCQCAKGSGLIERGGEKECSKCEEGYFTTTHNEVCRKWTDCKAAGVKTAGTSTSDVICNKQLINNTQIPTTSTSTTSVFSTFLQTHRVNSNKVDKDTHFTTSTTKPSQPDQKVAHDNDLGMYLLLFGIAGLLMLTAVICKLFLTPFSKKRPPRNHNGSCRTPVEESGDPTEKLHKVDLEP